MFDSWLTNKYGDTSNVMLQVDKLMVLWKKQAKQEAPAENMMELIKDEESFKSIFMRIKNECYADDALVCTVK